MIKFIFLFVCILFGLISSVSYGINCDFILIFFMDLVEGEVCNNLDNQLCFGEIIWRIIIDG